VHTLTLFDPEPTRIEDCGANFFLGEGDVGKPRAEVCAPKLSELNDEVRGVRVWGAGAWCAL
jgi:ubiquitin-activating enzyme E1